MKAHLFLLPALSLLVGACNGEASPARAGDEPGTVENQTAEPAALAIDAEAAKGRALFGECAICHQVAPEKGHRIGPNLFGVYGAPAARHVDFAYSAAMKRSEIVWTDEALDAFLESPTRYVRGTRMAYRGMRAPEDRAAMIAFLKTLMDEPAATPAESD